jgi:hypothetical protein
VCDRMISIGRRLTARPRRSCACVMVRVI